SSDRLNWVAQAYPRAEAAVVQLEARSAGPGSAPSAGDALRALLSDARSGDLSCAGETVSPGVFEEWFRGQMSGQVQEFVREVLEPLSAGDETSQETALFESLQALLAEQPVLRLQVAAEQLGVSPQQLIALSQRFSHVVGVLGDGDRLVFRAVAADDDDSVAVP
ncbi:MAG: hypothetical protein ACK6D4_01245, partial [Planctomyces sp.]